MAIAKYALAIVDCPDPVALANFYGQITDWPINEEHTWLNEAGVVGWTQLKSDVGATIGFARVENYREPTWPEGDIPQQEHLDFEVDDLDVGEAEILKIGARKAEYQPGDNFRVFLDPVGHPFCLVKRPG
jgi:hypothetical protein